MQKRSYKLRRIAKYSYALHIISGVYKTSPTLAFLMASRYSNRIFDWCEFSLDFKNLTTSNKADFVFINVNLFVVKDEIIQVVPLW